MKTLVNRYRQTLTVGQRVRWVHPRGGHEVGAITRFETTGAFARAYGPRVHLDTGAICAADDCSPLTP